MTTTPTASPRPTEIPASRSGDPARTALPARPAPRAPGESRGTARVRARAFVELTKPRITLLLLVTCVAGMFVAERGMPDLVLLLVTSLGLAMSSGGASALNHVIDRDIDAIMARTASRPVVAGTVGVVEAWAFGLFLMAAAGAMLWAFVNPLTSLLALGGGGFYVLGYTMLLKRTTVQNIVIGGAAGAIPPLVGWAAIENSLSPLALVLFLIIFLWTPPHFWALAMLIKKDYAEAGIPMMPVVRGDVVTANQIVLYSWALLATTIAPVVTGSLGALYGVVALALGARLLQRGYQLKAVASADDDTRLPAAKRMFLFSMGYLALLFLALVLDQTVLSLPLR